MSSLIVVLVRERLGAPRPKFFYWATSVPDVQPDSLVASNSAQ